MDDKEIKYFVEAALMAAGRPLTIDQIFGLFDKNSQPEKPRIREAIKALIEDYSERGITVVEVASGFRIQVQNDMVERLQKLWEERPPRYSRALFETLALIAYRQPMTRGEIEEIRGVAVSSNIIRTLLEREWVHVVGHRDVPGRPAMFGTTRGFLDYFNLKKLDDLPPLADLSDWESLRVQLNLPDVESTDGADVAEPEGNQRLLAEDDDGNLPDAESAEDAEDEAAAEHDDEVADGSEEDVNNNNDVDDEDDAGEDSEGEEAEAKTAGAD